MACALYYAQAPEAILLVDCAEYTAFAISISTYPVDEINEYSAPLRLKYLHQIRRCHSSHVSFDDINASLIDQLLCRLTIEGGKGARAVPRNCVCS